MYLKKFYKDYNFNKILSLIYIILPVVFLLKHNLAGVILVVLSIISLILIIKNKITINFKQNVLIFFFFIYIIANSILHENFIELRYVRFLLFYILLYFLIDEKFTKIFSQVLFFLIIFLCIDINLQHLSGYNLIGLKSLAFSTSFFGEEKIAGSFLLKIFFIYSLLNFFQKKYNYYKYFILLLFVLLSILFTGQRISILNLYFFCFLFFLVLKKYKTLIFIFVLIVVSLNIFSNSLPVKKFFSLKKFIEEDFNHLSYTIKAHDIDKIKLDKKINFNKFSFNENIGEVYYANNVIKPLNINTFFKDKRIHGKNFRLVIYGDEASERVKKYLGLKLTDNLSINQYIDYYNNVHTIDKNSFLFTFESIEKDYHTIWDTGWVAHFHTAYLIWKDNLFFGSGIKSYRTLCIDNEKYRDFQSLSSNFCVTHPHNFFLEILSELGLIGIGIFYSILFFICFRILNSNLVLQNKLLIICLILIMFQPLQTSGRIFSNNESMFIFYYLGILMKNINDKNFFYLPVKS
jgi:hypothetical protein